MKRANAGRKQRAREAEVNRHLAFQALLDHCPVALAVLDPDGTILRVNHAFAARSDREPAFFAGKSLFSLFPDPGSEELLRGAVREGKACEARAIPLRDPGFPDRPVSFWDWSVVPLASADGGTRQLVATAVDVSERVRADHALQIGEEQYRQLVDNSLQAIMVIQGPPPRVVYANRRCEEMTGYSVDELLALPPRGFAELVHPEDREQLFARLAAHFSGGVVPSSAEYRAVRKDGQVRAIRYFASLAPFGGVPSIQVAFVDTGDLRQAEHALRESEARFRQLAESVTDGFWLGEVASESEQRTLYANPAFTEIFGLADADPARTAASWLERVDPRDRERTQTAMLDFASGRAADYDLEYRIVRPGGGARWAWTKGFLIRDEQGGAARVAVVARDVTERRRSEQRLRAARRRSAGLAKKLAALHRSSLRLQQLAPLGTLAEAVLSVLEQTLEYEFGAVLLADEASGRLVPLALSDQGRGPAFAEADLAYVASHEPRPGKGITGWVAETGQSVRLGDVRQDPRYYPVREGIRSELCVPLRLAERTVGVVNIESTRPDAYTAADQHVLETIAAQIVLAIHNSELYDRERQHAQRLEERVAERTAELATAVGRLEREAVRRRRAETELARSYRLVASLNQVASTVSGAADAEAVWNALGSVVKAEGLSIAVFLLDEAGERLSVRYSGLPLHILAEFEQLTGHGLVGCSFPVEGGPFAGVLSGGRAIFRERPGALGVMAAVLGLPPGDVARVRHLFRESRAQRAIAVPLVAEARVLGAFVVRGADLQEADVPALELLADQVSNALERLGRARKAAELEILRQADRMRAELIANVSHEIRTPLGMIDVLCTSLLADDVAFDAETQRSFLDGIKQATDRLSAMVENLLQLSRVEDERLVLRRRPTDLGRLTAEVLERMRLGAPRHCLLFSGEEAEYVGLVDPEQMELVLSNLLSNAIKYSPEGGPVVVALAWQDDGLVLSVSDQGIGIAEEEQARIFERFYRVDSAVSRKVSGAGLGLAVCRAVVEAHGGSIRVASRPGLGSTFYVALPTLPPSTAAHGR